MISGFFSPCIIHFFPCSIKFSFYYFFIFHFSSLSSNHFFRNWVLYIYHFLLLDSFASYFRRVLRLIYLISDFFPCSIVVILITTSRSVKIFMCHYLLHYSFSLYFHFSFASLVSCFQVTFLYVLTESMIFVILLDITSWYKSFMKMISFLLLITILIYFLVFRIFVLVHCDFIYFPKFR